MTTTTFVLLPDHIVRAEPDITAWVNWFSTADRVVHCECVGPYTVSTVFLGINHNFRDFGPPLLFETMVFKESGGAEDIQERCSTWDEAVSQHNRIVERFRIQVKA